MKQLGILEGILFVMGDEKWIHEQIHEEQTEEEKQKHHFQANENIHRLN